LDKINILLIEDEAIIALDLTMCLHREGYHVIAAVNNGRDALTAFERESIDMILCDINILGDWDGIETMTQLLKIRTVPFLYLTAFSDRATLERAKKTFPAAYIHKPFTITSIRIAIEMAINNFAHFKEPKIVDSPEMETAPQRKPHIQETPVSIEKLNSSSPIKETSLPTETQFILRNEDILFIKQTHQFVKLNIHDIFYLEVDSKYVTIVTISKKYVLKDSLNNILDHINFHKLVRVHRSFVVNVAQIDEFSDTEILIKKKSIPIGRSYKEGFLQFFRFSR
jgi:two-component system, response regulator PdtaR